MEHLAVVTGASSGIGFDLAKYAAEKDYDLIVAANEPQIQMAADKLRANGTEVIAVQADLATREGVDKLYEAIRACGRPVDVLLANAGRGLGGAFLDQNPNEWRDVIETNITGTLDLIQRVGRDMRENNEGRILITGSIAGFIPGSYQAVYNASKAFLDSFAFAPRNELKDTDVTVTCLMPGAAETEFFDRAGMEDTKIGAGKKDDPAGVAKAGFEAMLNGEGDVVTGWMNKLQTAIANITPSDMLAERHRKQAEPGSARP
jgi:short-subunit dehydrogenase